MCGLVGERGSYAGVCGSKKTTIDVWHTVDKRKRLKRCVHGASILQPGNRHATEYWTSSTKVMLYFSAINQNYPKPGLFG